MRTANSTLCRYAPTCRLITVKSAPPRGVGFWVCSLQIFKPQPEKVATVTVATAGIATATQTILQYSPGVARSSSGGAAIRYILPVLWMTSCLHKWPRICDAKRRILKVTQRGASAGLCIGLSAAIGVQNKKISVVSNHNTSFAVCLFPVAIGALFVQRKLWFRVCVSRLVEG